MQPDVFFRSETSNNLSEKTLTTKKTDVTKHKVTNMSTICVTQLGPLSGLIFPAPTHFQNVARSSMMFIDTSQL